VGEERGKRRVVFIHDDELELEVGDVIATLADLGREWMRDDGEDEELIV